MDDEPKLFNKVYTSFQRMAIGDGVIAGADAPSCDLELATSARRLLGGLLLLQAGLEPGVLGRVQALLDHGQHGCQVAAE
jgi:hypothetical protein